MTINTHTETRGDNTNFLSRRFLVNSVTEIKSKFGKGLNCELCDFAGAWSVAGEMHRHRHAVMQSSEAAWLHIES
jgi:hypothetical protein